MVADIYIRLVRITVILVLAYDLFDSHFQFQEGFNTKFTHVPMGYGPF